MTIGRIVKLVDGEELVSFDGSDRPVLPVMDDPRRDALARRREAERAAARARDSHVLRDRLL